MALIPSLKDIPDLEPVEGGVEYDLQIIKAQKTKSNKTGRNGVLLVVNVVDEDNASNIMKTLWFGNDGSYTGDDEEKSNQMWRMVKDFVKGIGLDPNADLEAEDFLDVAFTAIVEYNDGIEVDDDGKETQEYPPKNEIGRITG